METARLQSRINLPHGLYIYIHYNVSHAIFFRNLEEMHAAKYPDGARFTIEAYARYATMCLAAFAKLFYAEYRLRGYVHKRSRKRLMN
jgi:hypothetical protein